ncbi:uncharacterized protein LOC110862509 [Folsomia candida]|uniref:Alpha-crystallin A chain n=1 Tax=Folsomia candida TaxID=158441 RepID=A0A226CZ83_FOLCA|nr:uncharacterized protein LOC110862509 [Folsomia candida]OXA37346.1 Alpha-crystallin A chain [Folsomia candida]
MWLSYPTDAYRDRYCNPVPKYTHSLLPNELGFAEVYVDDDKTRVKVDVVKFTVDEILITTVDGDLVIKGEHEDKEDEHGFLSRSFVRRFHLPGNSNEDDLRCEIDVDGILTVTVPRKNPEEAKNWKVHTIVSVGKHPHNSKGFLGKMISAALTSHEDLPTILGVQKTKDQFTIRLELPHFSPEVSVKTMDDFLLIQGEHEEKEDSHGFISRSFKRKYHLPLNTDKDQVQCTLNGDGILTVTVESINVERSDHAREYKIVKNSENCAK